MVTSLFPRSSREYFQDQVGNTYAFMAISLALAFSTLATLAADFPPSDPSLRTVFVQQLEQLCSCLPIQGAVKLINCWRNLQTGLQNNLLSLKTNVLGPFNKS